MRRSRSPTLEYATTQPQVRRDGDAYVLTLQPKRGPEFWIHLAVVGGVGLFCLACAVWPAGWDRVGNLRIDTVKGVGGRVLLLGLSAAMALVLWDAVVKRRTCVTLWVGGRLLRCSVPRIWGVTTETHDLTRFAIADSETTEGDPCLILRGDGGAQESLLNAEHYRAEDIQRAGRFLRKAIARAHVMAKAAGQPTK